MQCKEVVDEESKTIIIKSSKSNVSKRGYASTYSESASSRKLDRGRYSAFAQSLKPCRESAEFGTMDNNSSKTLSGIYLKKIGDEVGKLSKKEHNPICKSLTNKKIWACMLLSSIIGTLIALMTMIHLLWAPSENSMRSLHR